ncbi:murein DD-endopeptidase MepM/ murein hydrolase activator NlpD [Salibacterium salarium]|uniref:peptidoglycan DD-metalloendopeptidase family protein n=1 Tax=Salibacterium salarium TaxID=284579 RepID=UPI00278584C9|nr:peptidoglycan DD-metalloendopeptidase family protein [Salibacterium salarium]MDQ0299482.1 murein DD-endopeptidase MepM/ murein hydrolase activator NlpD [Salibacterium salarium]
MDYMKRFLVVGLFTAILICLMLFIGASSTYAVDDDYMWPTDGEITDTFGTRGGNHDGIDIAAKKGANVVASGSGEIIRSDYSASYGHVIFISHENNDETVYAHLSERLVEDGDIVSKGEVIGKVGNTGHSRGAHLHFELHEGKWNPSKSYAVNPLSFLKKGIESVDTTNKNNRTDEVLSLVRSEMQETNEHKEQTTYTVEEGDTLWGIAQTYDVTVETLQETNDIAGSLIYPDQELTIN